MVFSLRFLLTDFKISACRSEEHNNSAKDKGKQGYYFHRRNVYLIIITVSIKSGFEQCTNKK